MSITKTLRGNLVNNYKLITITLLLFSISELTASDSKFNKLSFAEKITQLTRSPDAVARIISAYWGFFKIAGKPTVCYDSYPNATFSPDSFYYSKQHKKNPSTYFTISDDNHLCRARVYWPLESDTALVFRSGFNLETLSVSHDIDPTSSLVSIARQHIVQANDTTGDIRCIVGEKIVPKDPETAALISPDNSKLIVFDPRSSWETLSECQQCASAQLPDTQYEFDPRIFVYPIDYNDTQRPKAPSCCSIS